MPLKYYISKLFLQSCHFIPYPLSLLQFKPLWTLPCLSLLAQTVARLVLLRSFLPTAAQVGGGSCPPLLKPRCTSHRTQNKPRPLPGASCVISPSSTCPVFLCCQSCPLPVDPAGLDVHCWHQFPASGLLPASKPGRFLITLQILPEFIFIRNATSLESLPLTSQSKLCPSLILLFRYSFPFYNKLLIIIIILCNIQVST